MQRNKSKNPQDILRLWWDTAHLFKKRVHRVDLGLWHSVVALDPLVDLRYGLAVINIVHSSGIGFPRLEPLSPLVLAGLLDWKGVHLRSGWANLQLGVLALVHKVRAKRVVVRHFLSLRALWVLIVARREKVLVEFAKRVRTPLEELGSVHPRWMGMDDRKAILLHVCDMRQSRFWNTKEEVMRMGNVAKP